MNHNARIAILYLIIVLLLLGVILWDLTGVPGRGHASPVSAGRVQATAQTHAAEKGGPVTGPSGMQSVPTGNQASPKTSETETSPGLRNAPPAKPAS